MILMSTERKREREREREREMLDMMSVIYNVWPWDTLHTLPWLAQPIKCPSLTFKY